MLDIAHSDKWLDCTGLLAGMPSELRYASAFADLRSKVDAAIWIVLLNILKGNNIQPVVPCTQAGVCGARDRRTADGGDRG